MAGPPPVDRDEVARRFRHHPPTEERAEVHASVRSVLASAAGELADILPEGRDKSTAITKLEEAMFWANASLARGAE